MPFLQLLPPVVNVSAYFDDPVAASLVDLLFQHAPLRLAVFSVLTHSATAVNAEHNGDIREAHLAKDDVESLRSLGPNGAAAVDLLVKLYASPVDAAEALRGEVGEQFWHRVAESILGDFPHTAREGQYQIGARVVPETPGIGPIDVLGTSETGAITLEVKASVRHPNGRVRRQIRGHLADAAISERTLHFRPLWYLAVYSGSKEARAALRQHRLVPDDRVLGRERFVRAEDFVRRRCGLSLPAPLEASG